MGCGIFLDRVGAVEKWAEMRFPTHDDEAVMNGAPGSPAGIAIGGSGNVLTPNQGRIGISEFTNTGGGAPSIASLLDLSSSTSVGPVAIDGSGNVWMILSSANTVLEVVGAAVPVVTPLSVGVQNNMLGTRP